jgi:hypothetical protein
MFSQLRTLLLCLALLPLTSLTGFSQQAKGLIDKNSWRAEPVRIEQVKTNGTPIEFGRSFSTNKDWLKDLTVSVKNMSDQSIARIEINLSFPRPRGTSPDVSTYVVRLIYGLEPSDPSFAQTQKPLMPGEIANLHLPDQNRPIIKADLASLGYPEEDNYARLTINSITFLDGSTWEGGETLYPDPKHPGRKLNPRLENPRLENPRIDPGGGSGARLEQVVFKNSGPLFGHPVRPAPMQDPTLPCNTVFVTTETSECSTSGSGCSIKQNIFDGSITLLGLRNARSQLSTTHCQKSDGTFCTSTPISYFERLPCGARVAGTCMGDADWASYPSTGCITGLLFGGPCTRSNQFRSRCADPTGYDEDSCTCPDGINTSPIVIDVDHSGFSMTGSSTGVVFNILADNVPLIISWTNASSTNAFLVLDRNGNGRIDSGEELFGNITPQPPSSAPNGFLALAEYDKSANGGNGNGKIEKQDAIYSQLRLWRDQNHNGISEPDELKPLNGLIRAIDLDYKESKRTDQFGNQFKYRAKVYDAKGVQAGRWAWDVFLMVE